MSPGNLLLLGMIAALASSGVVSSQRCLGSFLDLGSILLQRDSAKEHHGLLFYDTLLAVEDESLLFGPH